MANKIDDSDILQLLDIPSGSEDDFESDVDDDQLDLYTKYSNLLEEPDITTFEGLISQQFSFESIVDEDVIFPILEPVVDNSNFSDINISSPSTSTKPVIRKQNVSSNKKTRLSKQTIPSISSVPSIPPIEVKNVVWTEGNFPVINTHFLGNSDLPSDILELETPFQIFKYFFTSDLLDHICCETYKYGVQNNSSTPLKINNEDLQKYIGILILVFLFLNYVVSVNA